MNAFVTEIERGSTVDGPGIRTVVFLKGCSLRCIWCHNPETISREPQIMRDLKKCIDCGFCREASPEDAVRRCPVRAAELTGRELSLDDFVKTVLRDRRFMVGGGVTFSGGEALLQADWVAAAAEKCREYGIHTALDTALHVVHESVEKMIGKIDLFMVDLKHADPVIHKQLTGAGNRRILENLKFLDRSGCRILLRTPLIPGINDSSEHMEKLTAIARDLRHLVKYEFLPYNPLTPFKYERLGVPCPLNFAI